ncbi:MAG TPA: hypothetical protein VGE43_15975 [Acidimicrobiales bacterium]
MAPHPADEHPHEPGGDGWSETWSFDLASADGDLGGWVAFTRFADHAWYHAMLAGPRRQLLAVLDHHVPFRSNPLEVRTTGLWADHVCETPLDHWTLGLETFALGVDDPLELHGRQHGDAVALGFDLEWETDGPILDAREAAGASGYEMACRVHGEVLVGRDVIDFDGVGSRAHRWGPLDWAADDGWHLNGVVEGPTRWSVDHRDGTTVAVCVDGDGKVEALGATGEVRTDGNGLPTGASVRMEGGSLQAEVLAVTPVPIDVGGGRIHRPRALVRLRTHDRWAGVGWLERRGPERRVLDAG